MARLRELDPALRLSISRMSSRFAELRTLTDLWRRCARRGCWSDTSAVGTSRTSCLASGMSADETSAIAAGSATLASDPARTLKGSSIAHSGRPGAEMRGAELHQEAAL